LKRPNISEEASQEIKLKESINQSIENPENPGIKSPV